MPSFQNSNDLNNGFAEDTNVYTVEHGIIPMDSLLGQEVTVFNGDYQKSKVQFKSYGFQNVWVLILSRGDIFEKVVKVTPDHEWILADGVTRVKTRDLRRQELRSTLGDRWFVKEVIPTEKIVEVFCCEEIHTHSFILFGGLLTGDRTIN